MSKPWTIPEEAEMLLLFDAGINTIAQEHDRTVAAIVSRLEQRDKVINRDGKVFKLTQIQVDWD